MEPSNVEKEILSLEKKYWEAIRDRDAEAVTRMTDRSCLLSGAQGVVSVEPAAVGEMVKSPKFAIHAFELKDGAQVRLLGEDTAIVAYDVHEDLTVEGRRLALDAADASVWVRRGGTWLCALHAEALRGDPYGRDRAPRS